MSFLSWGLVFAAQAAGTGVQIAARFVRESEVCSVEKDLAA